MSKNLGRAQKAFAFFISSTMSNEGAVAFDKLRELRVSLDDVAYQNTDGAWLTKWGSIPFDMGSGSSDSIDREQKKQEQSIEHKHYVDIKAHQMEQYEKHEAFNRGEGYIGLDGEYHLFSEMKW